MSPEEIARVAHEINRAFCESIGDLSQPSWESAPDWQRQSCLNGVKIHLSSELTPQESHEAWMAEKIETGWKFGPVKDPERKEHPCLVPYSALSQENRSKDFIFRAVVRALSKTP